MKPIWILEDFLCDGATQNLANEVRAQGMECIVWNVLQIMDMDKEIEIQKDVRKNQCIIFMGSVGMVQNIQKYSNWIPGTWANFKDLECQNYYSHLNKYLLNKDNMILPVGELSSRINECFEKFGESDTIFIRPNRCDKSFSGTVLFKERIDKDLQWIVDPTFSNPNDIVYVSSPKNIVSEFRFIAAGDEIITGSLYKTNGRVTVKAVYDLEAIKLAREIAVIPYTSDIMKVIDICKTKDGLYHLLEIGGFSCAGLYACDLTEIVKHVSKIALKEWIKIENS